MRAREDSEVGVEDELKLRIMAHLDKSWFRTDANMATV